MNSSADTIIAVATGSIYQNDAALAVIRLSGKAAFEIVADNFFCSEIPEKDKSSLIKFWNSNRFRKVLLGLFKDLKSGDLIDQIMILGIPGPATYTGENLVEIYCHGSRFIINQIFQSIISSGASPAEPGEFTYRAYQSGKIDLIKAESVNELYRVKTRKQLQSILSGVLGKTSKNIAQINRRLFDLKIETEAELDLSSEYGFEDQNLNFFISGINELLLQIRNFNQESLNLEKLNQGLNICIIGPTNAGKSSLFNRLLTQDRSIVSTIPGTTRDIVSADMLVEDQIITLFDTAGLRSNWQSLSDPIEKQGIEKTWQQLDSSLVIVYLQSVDQILNTEEFISSELLDQWKNKFIIPVISKSDLVEDDQEKEKIWRRFSDQISELSIAPIWISSQNNTGINELLKKILKFIQTLTAGESATVITIRQQKCMLRLEQQLLKIQAVMEAGGSLDILSCLLDESLEINSELLGTHTKAELSAEIFNRFCIGK